ncbi:hypothetical protein FEM48_Zijuj01G0050300 [Ziziphus jujuba var. spinosa]|uniref:Uncharacterized protein n=1 Tax=Ziziphus jujuba var. spinosa TaxID=714518 RepID=A0A978VZ97_ZIZJJ|nr:hypothetical protein FEM48_Zijuj01G0050300 [Ziziphus jujuba var. spinosa]
MAAGGWKVAISVPLVVLLLLMVASLSSGSVSSAYRVRNLMAVNNNNQRQRNQIPNCNAMLLESQCSQNPKCRWCRSDALDDMCFAKVEAWRLPTQVFSCN